MQENQPVVDINTDVARSKTRSFLARHRAKMVALGLTAAAATTFLLGRRSKDVVESVDVDVKRADETNSD